MYPSRRSLVFWTISGLSSRARLAHSARASSSLTLFASKSSPGMWNLRLRAGAIVPCCGKGIRYEIRETRDGNIMPLPRDRSTGWEKKCVYNLGGRRTQSASEEEISRLSRRQSPFRLQHSDGGQLATTAEAAFWRPHNPCCYDLVESTGSSEGALKQWAMRQ